MKKWIVFVLAIVVLYVSSLFVRAEFAERKAEIRVVEILTEVASPWDASLMRREGSEWLLNRAPLSPEKLTELASNDLGSLREIIKEPTCNYQSGYERGSSEKKIWVICDITGRFEKNTATLKVRLVVEPTSSFSIFGPSNESLKLNDFMGIEIGKEPV